MTQQIPGLEVSMADSAAVGFLNKLQLEMQHRLQEPCSEAALIQRSLSSEDDQSQ